MACTIGWILVDMGQPAAASRYFGRARRAAHDARSTASAAYAAARASFAAFVRADTPTALDTAAAARGLAARGLAARTDDVRLQALAEQAAAGAYALDGQHRSCMTACDRAHHLLSSANGNALDSLAYWVHHSTIDSQRSKLPAQQTPSTTGPTHRSRRSRRHRPHLLRPQLRRRIRAVSSTASSRPRP
jgi:hypothetical protein